MQWFSERILSGSVIIWLCECVALGEEYYLVWDAAKSEWLKSHDMQYSPDGEYCAVVSDTELYNLYGDNDTVLDAVYGD